MNNFTIIVDTLRGTDPDHYCSSTHAFRGRFQIDKTFDFLMKFNMMETSRLHFYLMDANSET